MTELVLADEGEGQTPLPPSTDIDALRRRFLPGERKDLTLDRYQHAGVEIISTVRDLGQVLGELTELGWKHLRPHVRWNDEPIEDGQRTKWARYCAMLWGCSRATVTKAWLSATSGVERPQDMSLTTFYEIIAGCDTPDEIDEVVDLALCNEWRSYHIRIIKRLQDAGLLNDGEWTLPQVTRHKDVLYVTLDGVKKPFARIRDNDRLTKIGMFLLTDGAGITTEKETIDG